MTNLKAQVAEAAEAVKDDPSSMICFYEPVDENGGRRSSWSSKPAPPPIRCTFDELPTREYDSGYGGVNGEYFIGFTERFVYVRSVYDGAEWIDAVPRSPEQFTASPQFPELGGG